MALPYAHDFFPRRCDEVISPRWRAALVIFTGFTFMMLVFGAIQMTKGNTVEQGGGNTTGKLRHERDLEVYGTGSGRGPLKALAIGIWGLLVGVYMLVIGE